MFDGLTNPVRGGGFTTIDDYIALGVNLFLGIAMAVTFIGIVLSGIKFMSARSDPKAMDAAKSALTYSIVGFLLSVGAFTLLKILIGIVG